MIVIPNN